MIPSVGLSHWVTQYPKSLNPGVYMGLVFHTLRFYSMQVAILGIESVSEGLHTALNCPHAQHRAVLSSVSPPTSDQSRGRLPVVWRGEQVY